MGLATFGLVSGILSAFTYSAEGPLSLTQLLPGPFFGVSIGVYFFFEKRLWREGIVKSTLKLVAFVLATTIAFLLAVVTTQIVTEISGILTAPLMAGWNLSPSSPLVDAISGIFFVVGTSLGGLSGATMVSALIKYLLDPSWKPQILAFFGLAAAGIGATVTIAIAQWDYLWIYVLWQTGVALGVGYLLSREKRQSNSYFDSNSPAV